MSKRSEFNKICKDIKNLKIQGATNVAREGLKAYYLIPKKSSIKKLKKLRPTEPMLFNTLEKVKSMDKKKIYNHFDESQEKINKYVYSLIKNGDVIYTHCHSSSVVYALIYSKRKGKKFIVYNTETRPMYQGRKTAKELKKEKINVTMFVDSALDVVLGEKQGTKKVTKIFLGADAILNHGVINKIGSGTISKLAKMNKIPFYVVGNSWKYSSKKIKFEKRSPMEIWRKFRGQIKNPAFGLIEREYITKIISELGIKNYKEFLRKVK